MRWAVRAESYAVVHISQLDRDETGLKCGCVCSECDARLQAVNAGRPPKAFRRPGSLDQFFRHDSGQQNADCLFAAARLAALKLIVESGQLDLPPATVTHDHRAPSGHVYTATATGTALSTRVVNYHWIDRRSATLTLPDGKKILVHLQATSLTAADGQWDAELTIRINDPEVASWSPDEILEQIRLNPDFTCWERHWQHAELKQQALDDAVGIAARQGDAYPEGLDYDGPLPLESESPLHWAIKGLLAKTGRIRVPEAIQEVKMTMPDQTVVRRVARVPPTVLEILNVRLEQRLPGIVPDVLCTARDPTTGLSMELLIEVAVTHRVDESKLKKVAALGLACLELDATRFSVGGRVRLARVSTAIFDELQNKRWLHHPHLADAVDVVTKQLIQQQKDAQKAIETARARAAWLEGRSGEELREMYLSAAAVPAGQATILRGGFHWHLSDLAGALAAQGWKSATDEALSGANGILHTIHWIRRWAVSEWPKREAHALERLSAFMDSQPQRKLASLVCIAFKVYAPGLTSAGRAQLEASTIRIKESLDKLETDFARVTEHDEFVAHLFPEMRQALAKTFGTRRAIEDARRAKRAQELKAEEEQRQQQLAKQHQQRLKREQADLLAYIDNVCRPDWQRKSGLSREVEQILAREDVRRLVRQFEMHGFDAAGTVASAWHAREAGTSLRSWFLEQKPANEGVVTMIQQLLKRSWLLH